MTTAAGTIGASVEGAPVTSSGSPYPASFMAWCAVGVFFIAQIIATIDRGMISLVVDPIRHDLGISDVQIGLLQGVAFAIFYVLVGMPIGLLADVVQRKRLLIAGIVIWSIATVAGGVAESFGGMFASRLFTGIGEAVLGPCAVTMLSDMFPPEKRGKPLAIYVLGGMLAPGIGALITGAILEAAPKGAFDGIAALRYLAPWRVAYILVGASGILLALLITFVREPARTGVVLHAREGLGVRQALGYLGRNWRFFLPFYGAISLFGLGGIGVGGWGAAFLTRAYGVTPAAIGQHLGIANLFTAVLGAAIGSLMVERTMRRSGLRGKLLWAAAIPIIGLPVALPVLSPGYASAVVMVAALMMVSAMFGATLLATTTDIVPRSMKSLSVSIYALTLTLVGGATGSVLVAYLTEHFYHDEKLVGWSMALVGVPSFIGCSLLLLLSRAMLAREDETNSELLTVIQRNA